jgi:hypothetical protein
MQVEGIASFREISYYLRQFYRKSFKNQSLLDKRTIRRLIEKMGGEGVYSQEAAEPEETSLCILKIEDPQIVSRLENCSKAEKQRLNHNEDRYSIELISLISLAPSRIESWIKKFENSADLRSNVLFGATNDIIATDINEEPCTTTISSKRTRRHSEKIPVNDNSSADFMKSNTNEVESSLALDRESKRRKKESLPSSVSKNVVDSVTSAEQFPDSAVRLQNVIDQRKEMFQFISASSSTHDLLSFLQLGTWGWLVRTVQFHYLLKLFLSCEGVNKASPSSNCVIGTGNSAFLKMPFGFAIMSSNALKILYMELIYDCKSEFSYFLVLC